MAEKISKGANPGTRYGRLTVVYQTAFGRKARVMCACDCGNKKETFLHSIKAAVSKKHTPSCGCAIKEVKSENGLKRFDPTAYMQKRYGRLLVTGVSIDPSRNNVKSRLVCLCECGGQAIVAPMQLTSGKTTSCGCFHAERLVEKGRENVVHGHTTFGVLNGHTPVYRAWQKIRAGCLEGWRAGFHLVCHEYDPRWEDFQEFWRDFGDINALQTISRHDNQQPWSKENCFVNVGRRGAKAQK